MIHNGTRRIKVDSPFPYLSARPTSKPPCDEGCCHQHHHIPDELGDGTKPRRQPIGHDCHDGVTAFEVAPRHERKNREQDAGLHDLEVTLDRTQPKRDHGAADNAEDNNNHHRGKHASANYGDRPREPEDSSSNGRIVHFSSPPRCDHDSPSPYQPMTFIGSLISVGLCFAAHLPHAKRGFRFSRNARNPSSASAPV